MRLAAEAPKQPGIRAPFEFADDLTARPQTLLPDHSQRSGRIHIVMLNDVGFQYGAGIALQRQAASLLLLGCDVTVAAWMPGNKTQQPHITGLGWMPNWHGVHDLRESCGKGLDDQHILEAIADKIQSLRPDVVVVGNLHGMKGAIELLFMLRQRQMSIIAYMHDLFWITGRCAHPLDCNLYRTGCNITCPTSDQYPRLAPEKIAQAWRDKGELFAGPHAIPLIANSRWTRDMSARRFAAFACTDPVHLAVDHDLFSPLHKQVVRRLLGLPDDKPIVAMGAVSVDDQWKGGPLFHSVHRALVKRSDVRLILFGNLSENLESARSFGFVDDERLMPFIYNAADIFISTASAESFGQSMLEASACGVPVVALPIGGTTDVVVHEQTGLLVDPPTTASMLAAIDRLLADQELRAALGRNGRNLVEQNFTLEHQARAWGALLKKASSTTDRRPKGGSE
jgi:glycosyltransferase involved in cell wall biosynthesis